MTKPILKTPTSTLATPTQNHGESSGSNTVTIGANTYDLNQHTPMMVQYLSMKAQYPHALLLYRMGDFYELFFEDAHIAADILDITLTRRGVDKTGNSIAMAGVPYHAAESYMARLIAAGQTVVICEQIDEDTDAIDTVDKDRVKETQKSGKNNIASHSANKSSANKSSANKNSPNKKGIMRREVVKTLTAGTLTDDALIAPNQTPTVVAIDIAIHKKNGLIQYTAAISQLDLNAGYIRSQSIDATSESGFKQQLLTVLTRFSPSEAIIAETLTNEWRHWLQATLDYPVVSVAKSDFHRQHATETLCQQLHLTTLEGIGIADAPLMQTSSAALIHYAQQTQQRHIPQINELIVERDDDYLIIDAVSTRNLELFEPVNPNGTALIEVVNHCKTAMGKRLLISQLKRPLRIGAPANQQGAHINNLETLTQRLDAIEWLTALPQHALAELGATLKLIADIERIGSRIGLHSAKPRDLRRLGDSIYACTTLDDLLLQYKLDPNAKGLLPLLHTQLPNCHVEVHAIAKLIDSAIIHEPPAHIRDGGMIATGYDTDFDRLTHLHDNIQQTLDDMLEDERNKNQLNSLKVGFNKVSGFYFELPKGQTALAPDYFIRRQTLKNSERYVTEALKQLETDYLEAQINALAQEKALYSQLLHRLNETLTHIKRLSSAIAQLDVLINWACLAKQYQWTRPTLEPSSATIDIKAGRHSVVEYRLQQSQGARSSTHFVANDCQLATVEYPQRLLLITGPNMGGKSTYMRQTALITLLSCCGSFVPATRAHIGDIDRIFTRIGSADDLAGGKSTFMVEMIETAQILNLATQNSLVLMDEVGRGTSTTDGLAIAHACVLKLAQMRSLTLFATHYFELTQLAADSAGGGQATQSLRNLHVSATEVEGKLLLLHKIKAGAANSSFGLHVAQLAGVPSDVLQVAKAYLTVANTPLVVANPAATAIEPMQQGLPNNKLDLTNSLNPKKSVNKPTSSDDPNMHSGADSSNANASPKPPSLHSVAKPSQNQYDTVLSKLKHINPDELTPKQALDTLYALKQAVDC